MTSDEQHFASEVDAFIGAVFVVAIAVALNAIVAALEARGKRN